ncbi:MAG TPA: hypothetical protein VM223_09920 [Planctomycetota bacterium]|nr:hypothetical protein [Planctomycetota bacterium]
MMLITNKATGIEWAEKAGSLLRRTVGERCGTNAESDRTIVLAIEPGIGAEGYRISNGPNGEVVIAGNDGRGLIYGVGRFLREASYEAGRFVPGIWRGTSVPVKPVRGIYFASHFHNWYHDAPVADVCRYVEELALWGCNALCVWFDYHHFSGFDDPAAAAFVQRLRAILQAAREVGIGPALGILPNEAYYTSPMELRADWTAGHDGYFVPPGGHYHLELCPSKPGSVELLLKWRREMYAAFADLGVEYVWLWPYDQGGCTCSKCAPWGINGFTRLCEPVARLTREMLPSARIIVSTWYFDRFIHGEFDGFAKWLQHKPEWLDYVLVNGHDEKARDFLRTKLPRGIGAVDFPEISMAGMWPWGGFGANPKPHTFQQYRDQISGLIAGGFPYSEGRYEDLNKVLMLQWYWDPRRPSDDIVREYAAAEFSADAADAVVRAAAIMDRNLNHWAKVKLEGDWMKAFALAAGSGSPVPVEFGFGERQDTDECLRLLDDAERSLPERAARSWRWRVLWLRAALDAETERNGRVHSQRCEELFAELVRLYSAEGADEWDVLPPARSAVQAYARRMAAHKHDST